MKKSTGKGNPENGGDDQLQDAAKTTGSSTPKELSREVEEARSQLERTVSELSDRFSPGELIDQALAMAREHGGQFGRNLGSQVKDNPVPMILTGVGVFWMMLSSGSKTYASGDQAQAAGGSIQESAKGIQESLMQFYREQPLIAGSLGIAIGAALGALAPSTGLEDDVMGGASDRSIDAVKSEAAGVYREVRESAQHER